jgi:serine/threonine protein kinase
MTQRVPNQRAPVIAPGASLDDDLTVVEHLGGSRNVDIYLCKSELLAHVIACKVLRPEYCIHFRSLDAIREEGELLQRLRHPNVIEGYGVGLDNHPRIIMQHLPGETVGQAVLSGNFAAFATANLIVITAQVADALTYVHEQGLLHLDVKPSNVMYANGHATLFDFSVAADYAPGDTLRSNAGTRDYMAPEQAQRSYLSQATDVFGLGALFYELLTGGTTPFPAIEIDDLEVEGKTVRQLDYNAQPAPPSSLNPSVPKSIDPVALRSLALDPLERYATPAQFKRALARAIST